MIYISEFLLYCCFCILVGNQLLTLVPETKRPDIEVPNWLVNLCIIGIAGLSFSPLLRIVYMFSEGTSDLALLFQSILFDFNVGHAWLITLLLCAMLLFVRTIRRITKEPKLEYVSTAFTFALILAFAWASHCTASYQLKGFIPHAIHFLAVNVWIGTLLVVAWFSKNSRHWLAFLKWFSPVALLCLAATFCAGFFLMTLLVPEYVNSWIVSYGQALLIKHLLIVPLLVFAFINGVLVRSGVKQGNSINPIPWVRAESVTALLVFCAMAVMGQQSPPENLPAVIHFEKPSALFEFFYKGTVQPSTTLQFVSGGNFIILSIISVVLLLSMVLLYRRKAAPTIVFSFGLLFAGTAYAALMLGVN